MRFLFVGDVVGKPGRDAVHRLVPALRAELGLDAVVINCENAAAGKGVTPELADALLEHADVLTGGNHIWHYRAIEAYLGREPRLVRPANYPDAPGRGSFVCTAANGATLGVIQVEGRVFMRNLECPFLTIERELKGMSGVDAILVDVHAEATSEKQAIAWYFDGRVSAVVGTHTHVQTADERILPQGTAFLTDAGMTGPFDSVIGMEVQPSIDRFLTQRRGAHEVASGNVRLSGVVVEVDEHSKRAVRIERVQRALA
jgi:2',3'-cyclic-nucleotide 2'-phosphodiesterase